MKLYAFSLEEKRRESRSLEFNAEDIAEIRGDEGTIVITLKDGADYFCKEPLTPYKKLLPGFKEPEEVSMKSSNVFELEGFIETLNELRNDSRGT